MRRDIARALSPPQTPAQSRHVASQNFMSAETTAAIKTKKPCEGHQIADVILRRVTATTIKSVYSKWQLALACKGQNENVLELNVWTKKKLSTHTNFGVFKSRQENHHAWITSVESSQEIAIRPRQTFRLTNVPAKKGRLAQVKIAQTSDDVVDST